MSQNSFLALAPELKQAIFSYLPDVSSLLSITLTCSSFHEVMFEAESTILIKISQRQLHPLVAFDALVAFNASKLGPTDQTWSKEKVRHTMAMYDGEHSASWSPEWNLRDAFALERLNKHVEYFTQGFVASTLSSHPAGAPPGSLIVSNMPPSTGEIGRIQRTFYRFELYCNLFRKRQPAARRGARGQVISNEPVEEFGVHEQYAIFFNRFSAWENEQLACVRDFLLGGLSIPFNEVAEHDIDWGELSIFYIDDEEPQSCTWKEGFLVRGLAFLHELITASTYDVRRGLLAFNMHFDTLSLFDGLMHQPGGQGTRLMDWGPESRAKVLNRLHAADSDIGPKDVWLWAHETATQEQFYNHIYDGHPFLRKRGYVMWDSARWKHWKLLDLPWEDWEDLQVWQSHCHCRNSYEDLEIMEESFRARSKIWCKGGQGWWAPGDESKVIWPEGRVPKVRPSENEQSKSVVNGG